MSDTDRGIKPITVSKRVVLPEPLGPSISTVVLGVIMRGDNREYPDGQQVKELMVIVGTERSGVSTEDDREAGK